jgi:ornithine decarboxylase
MYAVKNVMKDSKKILFANPCKTPNDILTGKQLGISVVTADSCEELLKMEKMNYKPSILLRLAIDDESATSPFGEKFGLSPEKVGEAAFAAHGLGIPLIGLSFHIGSGSQNPNIYKTAIETAKDVWASLKRGKLVGDMQILDLGGGWSHEEEKFLKAASVVRDALGVGERARSVIAEPGRFFAAPVQDLYVRVVGKKPMAGSGDLGWRYTLDESVYGQFSCIPFDHACPKMARLKLDKEEPRKKTKAILFGRTCDSLDIIGKSIEIEELEVGDWLYFPNMGAYTTATSSEFNGFPNPIQFETSISPEEEDLVWVDKIEYPLAKMLDVKKACMF